MPEPLQVQDRVSVTHEVYVLCNCDEEPCRMEIYVSDVRILKAELDELRATTELIRVLNKVRG